VTDKPAAKQYGQDVELMEGSSAILEERDVFTDNKE